MLMEWFINNGRMPLAADISATDTELTVTGGISPDDELNGFYFVRATISAAGSSDMEVVHITKMLYNNKTLKVIRGRERTTAKAWPAGTVLECRVTAAMLNRLSARTYLNDVTSALSIADGENRKLSHPDTSEAEFAPNSWAIGGSPVITEMGGDWTSMSRSVEGVGASLSIDLGVPPDFDPLTTYYPGAVVRDPNPPHNIYSRSNYVILGQETLPLDTAGPYSWLNPWIKMAPDADGGIQRVYLDASWDDADAWFYPSEIGFICDQHSATSTPTVSVGEVDGDGELVSLNNLINAAPLTGIDGAHQRIVLATNIKRGVRGMIFSIDTAAAGGSFKGRFYWKGLFISSNTAAGWPTVYSPPDGRR